MRTIELNKKDLKNIISEAVKKVLNEDAGSGNVALSPQFGQGLRDLEKSYQRLKGFIGEYPVVLRSLLKNTRELGLVLANFSSENDFNLVDAFSGEIYRFVFEFKFQGIDVNSMSEEEYGEFENKLNEAYDNLEYMIGNPSFGSLRMYTTEDGIEVEYAFRINREEE